jgi:FkbM family methyltransferase
LHAPRRWKAGIAGCVQNGIGDRHALVCNEAQPMSSFDDLHLRARLRAALANLPGARLLYESLCGSPGSWLYRRPTLDWLSDPVLVHQLPRTYRWFAAYCAAQRRDPIGAELLLRGIIALRGRFAGSDRTFPLRIGAMTVFLDLHDPRFLQIPRELTGLPQVLRHFMRPGDAFIDVGANHGTFSLVASGLVGKEGLIIAIEPQPQLANLLRQSLAQSPARFEVHQIACGDRSEEIEFYVPRATSGSAGRFPLFSAISGHRTIQVAMRPIDDFIDARRLPRGTFIKLDVEGSELAFLRGARQLITSIAPVLFIEINVAAMQAAETSKTKLVNALIELGYQRFVTPHEPELQRPLTDQIVEDDIIALPTSYHVNK